MSQIDCESMLKQIYMLKHIVCWICNDICEIKMQNSEHDKSSIDFHIIRHLWKKKSTSQFMLLLLLKF